jgi:hypothetical protein
MMSRFTHRHSERTVARQISKVIGKIGGEPGKLRNQSEGLMMLELQPRRHRDGSIDLDYYRNRAARLRQRAIVELFGVLLERAVGTIGRVRQFGNRSDVWVQNLLSHRRLPSSHNSRVTSKSGR